MSIREIHEKEYYDAVIKTLYETIKYYILIVRNFNKQKERT